MQKIRNRLYQGLKIIELLIAVLLTIYIFAMIVEIAAALTFQMKVGGIIKTFDAVILDIYSLIVGVELIKMVVEPTSENILKVVMFAVARTLIMEHSSMLACLLGVISLVLLFAMQKYLFAESNILKTEKK